MSGIDPETPNDLSSSEMNPYSAFLSLLSKDSEVAEKQYFIIRTKLIRFFEKKWLMDSKELADETLFRAVLAISKKNETPQNIEAWCMGIARNVAYESFRRNSKVDSQTVLANQAAPQPEDPPDNTQDNCRRDCIMRLKPDDQRFIIAYYTCKTTNQSKGLPAVRACRRKLAEIMGISETAMRQRAHRIRETLDKCVNACLMLKGKN